MDTYVIEKEFLEKLGFTDFDSLENNKTNSYWDFIFLKNTVENYLENEGLIKTEQEIKEITNAVFNDMDNFDYSGINEQIEEVIKKIIK